MSARHTVLLLLAFAWSRVVTAHDETNSQSSRMSISHYNINYLPRQTAPLPSTSSIISAPNPPLGPTTTTTTAPGPASPASSTVGATNNITITTTTIIYITALPPSTSTTPSILGKNRKHTRSHIRIPAFLFNPYVIAPISAFVGLIQGILFAWCCIGRH